jgi:hypothetical protein
MAAFAGAIRANPRSPTGERKTIASLACDVWRNPIDPDGTVCLSRGGSFVAAQATGDPKHSSMTLEMTSATGTTMLATHARLDATVAEAVFAPYLAGGFRIIKTGEWP